MQKRNLIPAARALRTGRKKYSKQEDNQYC
jgi:hypothetical protein